MAEKRKRTTMSGMPRDEKKYSIREFLDDYGPMSNLMRLLRGHDEEVPSMSPGLGTVFSESQKLNKRERDRVAKILKKRKNEEALNKKEARGRQAGLSAEKTR